MKARIFILHFIVPLVALSQIQIGQDIDGEAADDISGCAVSLSANGNIVAVGAQSNDGNGTTSGHVRIFQNIGGVWVQIGDDIDGEAEGDKSGSSVSLNFDGSIVAIGADHNDGNGPISGHVRIFQNIGGVWVQIGDDIDGEESFDYSSKSIDLSNDGSIVAIGAYHNEGINGDSSGHVRIYQNIGGIWEQIGDDIDGEESYDYSGWSVSLNADGNIVAIGAIENTENGNQSGHVRVYQNTGGIWEQIGDDIDGTTSRIFFGWSVSLSDDGSFVAIGAPSNQTSGNNSGHVSIYQNTGGTWTQIGTEIYGETSGDWFGGSVSISADGSIVAIGAPFNNGNGTESGHIRVYKYTGGTWTKIGADIDGEAAGDRLGISVSLSADGNNVAIGAIFNDANGNNSGHTRIYDLSNVLGIEDNILLDIFAYPNPTDGIIWFNIEWTIKSVFVYDNYGKLILTHQDNSGIDSVDINEFSKGIYFLKIIDEEGNIEILKILKN